MGLIKARLGDYIEQVTQTNADCALSKDAVVGMTITKELIPTKAKLEDADISKYIVVPPNTFVYNPRTHGKHIGFGFNDTMRSVLISWNNAAFRISPAKHGELDARYLFLHFSRDEWDREACFCSWGSSTEVFSWNALCDMQINLPPIEVQRKYVAIYEAMLANQRAYEQGLDDLKLTCDAKMNDLVQRAGREALGQFVERHDVRNADNSIKNVKGVSTQKIFRDPTSKVDRNKLSNYKIVRPGWFSFVQTTHNEKCFAFAFNNTDNNIVVTSVNEVFSVDADRVDPDYLSLFFNRSEFDRYARFNSWGSARETFTWADLQAVEIPFIPISEQKAIADVYRSWFTRKEINVRLKAQLKDVCPILIRGSIEEASR